MFNYFLLRKTSLLNLSVSGKRKLIHRQKRWWIIKVLRLDRSAPRRNSGEIISYDEQTKTSGVGSDDQFKNMVEKVIRNKCLHVYFISPNGSITGD